MQKTQLYFLPNKKNCQKEIFAYNTELHYIIYHLYLVNDTVGFCIMQRDWGISFGMLLCEGDGPSRR